MPRSVRFSDETEAALVARAKELDRSVSWVIQRAVEWSLADLDHERKPSSMFGPEMVMPPVASESDPAAFRTVGDHHREASRKAARSGPSEDALARQAALNKARGL